MISTNHELFSADPPVSFLKNLGHRTIPWDLLQGFQLDCLRPDQRLRPPPHRLLPQARPSQKALVEDAQSQYPTHPHRDGPAPRLPQSPQLRYPRTRFALEQGPDSILGPVPEEELVLFGNLCSALNRCGNSLARSTRAVHRIGGNSTQIRVGTQIERAESRTSPTRIVPTAPIRVGHCWCSSPWPCLPALTTSPPFSDTPSSSPRPNALGLAFRARKAPLSAKSPATPPCATCSSESILTNWPTASIVGSRPTSAPFPAPWPSTANGFAIAP